MFPPLPQCGFVHLWAICMMYDPPPPPIFMTLIYTPTISVIFLTLDCSIKSMSALDLEATSGPSELCLQKDKQIPHIITQHDSNYVCLLYIEQLHTCNNVYTQYQCVVPLSRKGRVPGDTWNPLLLTSMTQKASYLLTYKVQYSMHGHYTPASWNYYNCYYRLY